MSSFYDKLKNAQTELMKIDGVLFVYASVNTLNAVQVGIKSNDVKLPSTTQDGLLVEIYDKNKQPMGYNKKFELATQELKEISPEIIIERVTPRCIRVISKNICNIPDYTKEGLKILKSKYK
jgi:hypothetical protein